MATEPLTGRTRLGETNAGRISNPKPLASLLSRMAVVLK